MSEYINKDIFKDEEFKHMQAVAEEVSKWPEWKRDLCGIDNYSRIETETPDKTGDKSG